jgi:hypothetical protein
MASFTELMGDDDPDTERLGPDERLFFPKTVNL